MQTWNLVLNTIIQTSRGLNLPRVKFPDLQPETSINSTKAFNFSKATFLFVLSAQMLRRKRKGGRGTGSSALLPRIATHLFHFSLPPKYVHYSVPQKIFETT